MERKAPARSVKARFNNLFRKKGQPHPHIEPSSVSEEAALISENADKLIEAPRELVMPELSPAETVVAHLETEPVEDIVEQTPSSGWRKRLPSGFKGRKNPAEDRPAGDHAFTQRPIRVFIGYVPDVTEKDARFFAMGVAEKHVESEYISYLGVFRYGTGYAYEIQEGGHGHSYLTRIIKYFNQLPPNLHDAETAVFITTASRMVQVEKTADGGLVCIQLPESYKATETDWLRPEKKLKLLRDQNSGVMMIGGAFLGISLLVLAGAFLTRYVPREAPTERVWYDTVSLKELPVSQWDSMIQETNNGHYILSLRYDGRQWCRKTEVAETCGETSKASPIKLHPSVAPGVAASSPSAPVPVTAATAPTPGVPASAAPGNGGVLSSGAGSVVAPQVAAPQPTPHPLPPLPAVPAK